MIVAATPAAGWLSGRVKGRGAFGTRSSCWHAARRLQFGRADLCQLARRVERDPSELFGTLAPCWRARALATIPPHSRTSPTPRRGGPNWARNLRRAADLSAARAASPGFVDKHAQTTGAATRRWIRLIPAPTRRSSTRAAIRLAPVAFPNFGAALPRGQGFQKHDPPACYVMPTMSGWAGAYWTARGAGARSQSRAPTKICSTTPEAIGAALLTARRPSLLSRRRAPASTGSERANRTASSTVRRPDQPATGADA